MALILSQQAEMSKQSIQAEVAVRSFIEDEAAEARLPFKEGYVEAAHYAEKDPGKQILDVAAEVVDARSMDLVHYSPEQLDAFTLGAVCAAFCVRSTSERKTV